MVNAAVFLLWGRANCDDNCPVRSYLDGTRTRLLGGSYSSSHIGLGEERGPAGHVLPPWLRRRCQPPSKVPCTFRGHLRPPRAPSGAPMPIPRSFRTCVWLRQVFLPLPGRVCFSQFVHFRPAGLQPWLLVPDPPP